MRYVWRATAVSSEAAQWSTYEATQDGHRLRGYDALNHGVCGPDNSQSRTKSEFQKWTLGRTALCWFTNCHVIADLR